MHGARPGAAVAFRQTAATLVPQVVPVQVAVCRPFPVSAAQPAARADAGGNAEIIPVGAEFLATRAIGLAEGEGGEAAPLEPRQDPRRLHRDQALEFRFLPPPAGA